MNLSKDVLGLIFTHLKPGERCSVPLVSKKWNKAMKENKKRCHISHVYHTVEYATETRLKIYENFFVREPYMCYSCPCPFRYNEYNYEYNYIKNSELDDLCVNLSYIEKMNMYNDWHDMQTDKGIKNKLKLVIHNMGLCPRCHYDSNSEEGVSCFGCVQVYCDNCWENIEVPNGADDGQTEMCTACIDKFLKKHKYCEIGEEAHAWECLKHSQIKINIY